MIELVAARTMGEHGLLHHWLFAQPNNRKWLPGYHSPSELTALMNHPEHEFLLAELDGNLIGFVHLRYFNRAEATFSYFVSEQYRGRGLGSAVLTALSTWAATKNINRLLALVAPANTISVHALVRAGFTPDYMASDAAMHVYLWSR